MAETGYRQSGVDIDAGNEVVRRIKQLARGTYSPGVLSGVGSFGGLFALDPASVDPVLVASADGVGTKLKLAFMSGVHHTIGRDLVNHCVNDILVQGARPLFFLDYLATGHLTPDVAERSGTRNMTWECDYPHSDSDWPTSPEAAISGMDGLDDATINALTHENAIRLFGYEPFAFRAREECTVGALRAEAKAAGVDTAPRHMRTREQTMGAGADAQVDLLTPGRS